MDINFFRRNIGYIILIGALLLLGTATQSALAEDNAVPEGFHDGNEGGVDFDGCSASGWTADPDDPDRDLQVQILVGETVVATTTADLLRPDVTACTGGTCGFYVSLWDLVAKDVPQQITVQAYDVETDQWYALENTPKELTCLTPDPFVVNTTDDNDDGLCDALHCSLREALNATNNSPSPDQIIFAIPGEPPYKIQPLSSLPGLDNPVTIDGTTQPGF